MAVMTVMGSSAWALDQKDGVYQIGSLEDYLAFASLVVRRLLITTRELSTDRDTASR